MTGGMGNPKNFPLSDARFFSQSGTTPNTVPPVTVGRETKICTPPTTIKPTPSVTMRACPCKLKLIKPLSKSSSVKKDGIILDYWFLLEYEGKKLELKPQTEEGISDYRWVSKKDIIKYYPYFRKYVCEVLRYYLLEKEKSKKS